MADDLYTVVTETADILNDPSIPHVISNRDSQLLFGEEFRVLGKRGTWFHGISVVDSYAGHVHESKLKPGARAPAHAVSVRLAHIYPRPDFKTRPLLTLSFMSRVKIDSLRRQHGFVSVPDHDGWIFEAHIAPLGQKPDGIALVDTALQFFGTPYLYGGRSAAGLDCSGLVQLALFCHGMPCPRDSGDQEKALGVAVDRKDIRRGDLVFFKGHVGIMVDENYILNATARTMDTRIESLEDLAGVYGGITSIKRIS